MDVPPALAPMFAGGLPGVPLPSAWVSFTTEPSRDGLRVTLMLDDPAHPGHGAFDHEVPRVLLAAVPDPWPTVRARIPAQWTTPERIRLKNDHPKQLHAASLADVQVLHQPDHPSLLTIDAAWGTQDTLPGLCVTAIADHRTAVVALRTSSPWEEAAGVTMTVTAQDPGAPTGLFGAALVGWTEAWGQEEMLLRGLDRPPRMTELPGPPARIELTVAGQGTHQLRVTDVEPARWPRRPRPDR